MKTAQTSPFKKSARTPKITIEELEEKVKKVKDEAWSLRLITSDIQSTIDDLEIVIDRIKEILRRITNMGGELK